MMHFLQCPTAVPLPRLQIQTGRSPPALSVITNSPHPETASPSRPSLGLWRNSRFNAGLLKTLGKENRPVKVTMNTRLPPEVNRILFVKSLPYKITAEDMYDIFGKYGSIRQIRLGNTNATRGTAYVVYDDIHDAKAAYDALNGFQVAGRYLVLFYNQPKKTHS